MSERIVNDPSQHGWVETDDGKWVWDAASGGSGGGSIQDGDTVGQVTTWSGAEWTPDSSLTIDSSGNATFNKSVTAGNYFINTNAGTLGIPGGSRFEVYEPSMGNDRRLIFHTADLGNTFYIDSSGDATFSGTVNANDFVGDGSALTGMYSGDDAVKTTGNQTIGGIKTFSSDIRCKANVYAYYGSDERLKDDIAPMPLGLIDDIDPSTWKWKEDGRSSGGVIAQQLQQIGLDDWVRESPEGDLGVDYNALIGMLIAEVKDLKRQINER